MTTADDEADGSESSISFDEALTRVTAIIVKLQMEIRVALGGGPMAPAARAAIVDAAAQYGNARARGWGRTRRGAMLLLEALDGAESAARVLSAHGAMWRLVRGTPLDGDEASLAGLPAANVAVLRETLKFADDELFRDGFNGAANISQGDEVQAVRALFSAEFPLEAERLTTQEIEELLTAWRRGPGRPPIGAPRGSKWDLVAATINRLFGSSECKADAVQGYWGEWRSE